MSDHYTAYCEVCPKDCRKSFVYVISGRKDGWVKVGYAANPRKRLDKLRKQTGYPLEIVRKFEARCEFHAMEVEEDAHRLLREYWVGRGEWFMCSVDEAANAIREVLGGAQ